MRKLFFTLCFFVLLSVKAQRGPYGDPYSSYGNQELKFNIGLFLANTTIEGSYEYFFSEDTSFGGTLYFSSDETAYNGNFGIGPNFRAYFGGYQPRSGFFAEIFGLYYTGEEEVELVGANVKEEYSQFALGIGAGNKWVTRSNRFTIEINAGIGRNVNADEDYLDDFMFRGGLSVGFRF